MSICFNISLEEKQEAIDPVEPNNELDYSDKDEIDFSQDKLESEIQDHQDVINQGMDLAEGMESLAYIASKIENPTPIHIALFRTAANMAVAGSNYSAEAFLPAMESNKPIAMEGFVEKTKEIIAKIIAMIKAMWEKIKSFISNIFSKTKVVQNRNNKLVDDIENKISEVKDNKVNEVKTKTPYNIFTSDKTLLLENNPTKVITKEPEENHQKEISFIIPEKVDIYIKDNIIFPHKGNLYVYMHQGNYLNDLAIGIENYHDKITKCKEIIIRNYQSMDGLLINFNKDHLSKNSSEFSEEILINFNKELKEVYYKMTGDFINAIANPNLKQQQPNSNISYQAEITGGYGFQTKINDDKTIEEIYFHSVKQEAIHDKETCQIDPSLQKLEDQSKHHKKLLENCISKNELFNKLVVNKEDLNTSLTYVLNNLIKQPEKFSISHINESKDYILKMNKIILAITNFDNYILNVINESDRIAKHVLNLWTPYYD